MPDLSLAERARIVRGVWENLGRTAAEMPHLAALLPSADGAGWEVEGEEHLDALRRQGGPALFFSGHLANWELIGPAVAALGVPMAGIYRAASNPVANDIIQQLRNEARDGDQPMFAKGAQGARAAMAHLNAGRCLGMFVDQKMNDGIPVTFFGRPAMTAPALAHFALRFRCPVIPIHVERLGPAHFRLICEAPLTLPATGDRAVDAQALTLAINGTLEKWIRDAPESWLWLHRRWPADKELH
jgi:KDO2-lipid IV(A) lauroyltransferase